MDASGQIGLVGVQQETHALLAVLRLRSTELQGGTILHQGKFGNRPVALAEVLPGPVNAALGAQALIACHGVRCLISLGSAGALDPGLALGDLVIARRAAPHDAGIFLGRRFVPGGVMGRSAKGRVGHWRFFEADPQLVLWAQDAVQILNWQAHMGLVVSGNQVVFSTSRREWLRHTFGALAVDMETAAVAQAAVAHRLPWVGLRTISDRASDDLVLDYHRLLFHQDDRLPAWQHQVQRWFYLMTHPVALRRVHRLRKGLALASERLAQFLEAMLSV